MIITLALHSYGIAVRPPGRQHADRLPDTSYPHKKRRNSPLDAGIIGLFLLFLQALRARLAYIRDYLYNSTSFSKCS